MLITKNGSVQNDNASTTRSLMAKPPKAAGKHSISMQNGRPVIDRFDAEDESADLLLADISHLPKAVVAANSLAALGDVYAISRCL